MDRGMISGPTGLGNAVIIGLETSRLGSTETSGLETTGLGSAETTRLDTIKLGSTGLETTGPETTKAMGGKFKVEPSSTPAKRGEAMAWRP